MSFGPFLPTGVFLDGVQFSTDPEPYEPLVWAKRHSEHMTIGGGLVIQDFGAFMKDNTVRLGSGQTRLISEDIMLLLYNKYLARGFTYTFTDWLGNDFQVFIKSFVPVPFKRGADKGGNSVLSLYTYTMELQVLQINKIAGATYTGS